jgi:hypothetical protein
VGGNPSKSTDQATLVLFGFMSCATALEKQTLGKYFRLLAPTAIGESLTGMFWGNFILIVGVAVLSCVVVVALSNQKDGTLRDAMVTAKFPGLLFAVCVQVYQGTTLVSLKLLNADNSSDGERVVGLFGTIFSLCIPSAVLFYARCLVLGEYHLYDFRRFSPDGPGPVCCGPFRQWQP